MIWLLTGLAGSRFVSTLQENIDRFSFGSVDFRLVVVENGSGVGCWKGHGDVLKSEPGVPAFLKVGLDFIREHAATGDWFARIDADDYYGSGYLKSVEDMASMGATFTGSPSVYVRTEDDHLYYLKSRDSGLKSALGGTLAGLVERAVDFPDTGKPWGEDTAWVTAMRATRAIGIPREASGYALCRHTGHEHTYPVHGHEFAHLWPCLPYHLGLWSESRVNGPLRLPERPILQAPFSAFSAIERLKSAQRD